jgi:uncharacterized damage-inducible protein DinB
MKAYFKRLFAYDLHANMLLAQQLQQTPIPQAITWLAHMAAAQKIWLSRCAAQGNTLPTIWPDWDLATSLEQLQTANTAWQQFLEGLANNDTTEHTMVDYTNMQGVAFTNRLSDIIAHVINHGTHHRAQIGQALKAAGINTLPITDYIFFLRQYP